MFIALFESTINNDFFPFFEIFFRSHYRSLYMQWIYITILNDHKIVFLPFFGQLVSVYFLLYVFN